MGSDDQESQLVHLTYCHSPSCPKKRSRTARNSETGVLSPQAIQVIGSQAERRALVATTVWKSHDSTCYLKTQLDCRTCPTSKSSTLRTPLFEESLSKAPPPRVSAPASPTRLLRSSDHRPALGCVRSEPRNAPTHLRCCRCVYGRSEVCPLQEGAGPGRHAEETTPHRIHGSPTAWIERQKSQFGARVLAVELADDAISLPNLPRHCSTEDGRPARP